MLKYLWAPFAFTIGLFQAMTSLVNIKQASMKAGDLQTTGADEGNSIPVVFGTVDLSPNVVAFSAETPEAIRK